MIEKVRPSASIEWSDGNDGRDGRYYIEYRCPNETGAYVGMSLILHVTSAVRFMIGDAENQLSRSQEA